MTTTRKRSQDLWRDLFVTNALDSRRQKNLLVLLLMMMAIGTYTWELRVSNILSFYDSGTYLAGSINLVNGVIPYRDFTFVQPPGILIVLSPIALIGKLIGVHTAFLVGRVFSAVISAANVGLLAWLLRSRGRTAILIGGIGLAFLPIGSYETAGIKLEPYCVFFILLGVIALLHETPSSEPSRRNAIIGGLLFGIAGLIKIFAFLPFLGMVIALYPRSRRRVLPFVASAGVGFALPALPFFLAGPNEFISQVLTEQLFRKSSPGETLGVVQRFIAMIGLSGTWLSTHAAVISLVLLCAVVIVVVAYSQTPSTNTLESFFLWASVLTAAGLLMAAQFINYYGYFSEPFLLGMFGISLNRVSELLPRLDRWIAISTGFRRLISVLGTVIGAILAAAFLLYSTTYYSNQTRVFGFHLPDVAPITKLMPTGACVIYDNVALGIAANRWPSSVSGCPHLIDPFGMWLAWGYHLVPAPPAFTAEWKAYFEKAQYVVLGIPRSTFIPWNHGLRRWFMTNFQLIHGTYPVYIYRKK